MTFLQLNIMNMILILIYRSPLASIYSTSTMENHHFNMAINILQQVLIIIINMAINILQRVFIIKMVFFPGAPQYILEIEP